MNWANYWGKAGQAQPDKPLHYHLLVWHSLDVAACAETYLQQHPALLEQFAKLLKLSADQARRVITFIAAVHDLGKFASNFQGKRPDIFQQFWPGRTPSIDKTRHDSVGFSFWHYYQDFIGKDIGLNKGGMEALTILMAASHGHHGLPPSVHKELTEDLFEKKRIDEYDREQALDFIQYAAGLLLETGDLTAFAHPYLIDQDESNIWEEPLRNASWLLAGLMVMADWLGSSVQFFPYETVFELTDTTDPVACLAHYWQHRARPQAGYAVTIAEAAPARLATATHFRDLFPQIAQPTPLQTWADQQQPVQPVLYILEDTMGAGKTEAALTLAARILAQSGQGGLFIALPTMATANSMYARMQASYQRLFPQASLLLSHGSQHLQAGFMDSVGAAVWQPDARTDQIPVDDGASQVEEELSATARCAAWLADQNKKALLAPVGVGTIDQLLLGVLKSRHQSLRMLGMFGKVLILDEVHAFDLYMQTLIQRLLTYHAMQGGSAILLSATLTRAMRQQLVRAYAAGLGNGVPELHNEQDYPLATQFQTGQVLEQPLAPRPDSIRQIGLRWWHQPSAVLNRILQAQQQGNSVVWLRNTVGDVIDAAQQLTDAGLDPDRLLVFHARFCRQDRIDIEKRFLDWLGKASTPAQRTGKVIVCSQVAEVSIDFDCDVLITDLAPIDNLLQRAGRLHRHRRDAAGNLLTMPDIPDGRPAPVLDILAPMWTDEVDAQWYEALFPAASHVYQETWILHSTMRVLRDKGLIDLPVDARDMVNRVYNDIIPPELEYQELERQGEKRSQISIAQNNLLMLQSGYSLHSQGTSQWMPETRAPTRLAELSQDWLLLRWQDECLTCWHPDQVPEHSMISLPVRVLSETQAVTTTTLRTMLDQLLETLPARGKWIRPLVLQQSETGDWICAGINGSQRKIALTYSDRLGLQTMQPA